MDLVPFKFRIEADSSGCLSHHVLLATVVPLRAYFTEDGCPSLQRIQRTTVDFRLQSSDDNTLREFGKEIFRTLFPGALEQLYRDNLAHAEEVDARLWIQLCPVGDVLSAVPWELAFDAVRGAFISTSPLTPFSRFVIDRFPVREGGSSGGILVCVTNKIPDRSDLAWMDAASELRCIEKAVEMLGSKGLTLNLKILDNPTFDQLSGELAGPWNVLHYLGHGVESAHGPSLVFPDSRRRSLELDAGQLSRWWQERSIRLILLNSCFGAAEDSARGSRSMVYELARSGFPMAIAHRTDIPDDDAINFAATFYGLLSKGNSVPAAVNEGRLRLQLESATDPGVFAQTIPYLQTLTGDIFGPEIRDSNRRLNRLLDTTKRKTLAFSHGLTDADAASAEITSCRRILSLFGTRIFDWQTTRSVTQHLLGESDNRVHLQPFPISPYCGYVPAMTTLQWNELGDVRPSIQIHTIAASGNSTIIWSGELQPRNSVNVSELGLTFSQSAWYCWELSYEADGRWQVHNGVFRILPSPDAERYDRIGVRLSNRIPEGVSSALLRAGLLYDLGLNDAAVHQILRTLPECRHDAERIPLLALLLEVYVQMRQILKHNVLPVEEDRVLGRMAAVDDHLGRLYGINTDTNEVLP